MVLSGGLGSSAYVRDQLQQRFLAFPHPNSSRVAVIPCNDPQLVVVRGLLLDRQQRWQTNNTKPILASRLARASYGVIVEQTYSPEVHIGEGVRVGERDRKKKTFASLSRLPICDLSCGLRGRSFRVITSRYRLCGIKKKG